MQSSEELERPSRPLLTAEQKIELLARLQKAPSHSKAIAKVAGISEITLHAWRTSFAAGQDLVDDVAPPDPTPIREVPAPTPLKKESSEMSDTPPKIRRKFPDEFRYNVGKAVIDGEIRTADAARKYDVHPSLVHGWVQLVKNKKLKPLRGKPGPKPKLKDAVSEVVQEYRPQQTQLSLPPRSPRTELARVTTIDEELASKDREIARLKRLLLQTQAMLLENGE